MCSPCTRDRILLSDDEMNEFLEVCSEKVLKSCSPSLCALIDDKDKSEGFNDPLISMIKDLFCKAAIIPISDLISDPEFLNQCIARLFKIKIRDDALFELESINEYLQNPTEQLLIPFTNSTDGMIRSITVDTVSIVKEVVSNSSPGSSLPRLKLHKRSLSQPKNIDSHKKNSIADGLQNTQKIIDVLPCEAGIDLDSYPNPNSRVFKNIRINKWELVKNSKEMYVCYIITVDALFEELHPQKMYPSTADEETREECIVSSLIWKNLIVKHRFREFVDLQVKLENSARLRGTLRGMNKTVIKPSTLKLTLNLISFNPLRSNVSNKTVIEHRRRCLEKYLNELSKFEKISRSREFRDFLGYREERSSFLRSPSQSILVPLGIDKVYRNVRDAITFLKPSNPQEGTFAPGPTLVISDSPLTCLKLTKLPHNKPSKILKIISEPRFVLSLMQSVDTKKEINSGNTSPDFCFLNLGKRSSGDGCDNSSVDSHCKDRSVKIPLVESLINIVQTIIPLSNTSWFSLILLTIKVYLGTTLERLIGALIIRICCTETFVYLLHNLHESIWEDEENDEWIKHELPSASHLVHKFVNMLKYKSLFNYLPVTYLEQSVQSLFNTFQSKDHNKMFILLVLSSLLKRSQIH